MNLGIYIQVPFCQTKCTYCNFHTGVFAKSLYEPYVDAICRELADREDAWSLAAVDTVYIGGGKPSLLDSAEIARILDTLRAQVSCRLEEVTLEADPENIYAEKTAALFAAGGNCISIGV